MSSMTTNTISIPTGAIALQKHFLALCLKERREQNNLSQDDLAKEAGISQAGLCRLETGRGVKIDEYLAVMMALQLDPQELWATVQNRILQLEKQAMPDSSKDNKPHDPAFSMLQARLMLEKVGISKEISNEEALLELTKRLFGIK